MHQPSHRLVRTVFVLASTSSFACGSLTVDESAGGPESEPAAATAVCVVPAPEGVVALKATARGVVFAATSPDGAALVVQRTHGKGCALSDVGAPIAAGAAMNAETWLDADDHDNVYVFPSEATADGVISTMLPDEYPGSMLARIDADGRVSKLLPAGRGIWDFGVAPAGDAVWVSACGPTGLFSIDDAGVANLASASMTPPDTLWAQSPSVLTDAQTFWSVGTRTCAPTENLDVACGFALVRATPAGAEELGTTLADHGDGVERAALARCGAGVCGVFSRAVSVWGADGAIARTITLVDLGALPSERIAAASGNRAGVYVLLQGEAGPRVVHVPVQITEDHGR